jgi:hypothetical protein
VMCMQKGAPRLRLALSCGLRLELTYRDPSVPERINECVRKIKSERKPGYRPLLLTRFTAKSTDEDAYT